MRLLDLFCGAGGAAVGYHQAGFDEIVGVDIEPQPNYPFEFVQGDALRDWDWGTGQDIFGGDLGYDLIHASPPCQAYSTMTREHDAHPDLIAKTRQLLNHAGRPYVIENVPGAPLEGWVIELCGSMFGLDIQRHRRFELHGFPMVMAPGGCNHKGWVNGRPWTVTGNLNNQPAQYQHSWKPPLDDARRLLDVPWMQTAHEITEAIPPAYTKFIGEQFISQQVAV